MRAPSAAERLRYAFDNSMSRGPIMLIAWLALASIVLIFAISLFVWVLGLAPAGDDGGRPPFTQLVWMGLMRTLDAGTMGGDQGSWPFLFSMLAVTFGGIFVISTLIGVLTAGIEQKLEELRKGRSRVLESGHTVILGWSPQVFTIVSELCLANRSRRRAAIVILAPKDKVEMEDELRERVPEPGPTHIVCRTGDPTDLGDLEIAAIHDARSIVVVSPPGDSPDTSVIKTLLAITNNPNRRKEPYHVVAELREPRNMDVARMVGKEEVELVLSGELLSRVAVQTCRQSGLSVVYLELLDFGGDEIYFKEEPGLVGRTFGEALNAYEESAVIGLRLADGGVRVNPPMDRVIAKGDKVIAIAEDDDTVSLSAAEAKVDEAAIAHEPVAPPQAERTLVLGWNWRVPAIVKELDHYVAPASELTAVTDAPDAEAEIRRRAGALQNLEVRVLPGDTTDRATLDALDIPRYHHVILVADGGLEAQAADARVLMTLLHLRDISDRSGRPFSIVSEMVDVRNRELAEVTRADDFIVGERLVSLLMTQISENKELAAVFEDLFDPEGSEIYLKPAEAYVATGRPVTFHTVVESARRRGHLAIGYRRKAEANDAGRQYGVVVNPKKSEAVTFAAGDRVIVLAED